MPTLENIDQWLALDGRAALVPWIKRKISEIADQPYQLIDTANPIEFLVEFWAAVLSQKSVILTNPSWGRQEKLQLQKLLAQEAIDPCNQILIPTGGTSGQLKFAIHTPQTLSAAVAGFQQFYGVTAIHSCCLLPLHHVSGLMQLWRSSTTKGRLILAGEPELVPPQKFFLSLVPTQLQRWLELHSDWLKSFRAVIIGGAPLSKELADRARTLQIPLSPSYGATETAAMVAAMPPTDFLAGHLSSGIPLPHVELLIDPDGQIMIQSSALMQGYYPSSIQWDQPLDDFGKMDEWGHLQILGRASHKIISGGEKIFPPEVEAVILATGLVQDVAVIGWPDLDWGERVVALYVPLYENSECLLQEAIAQQLSKFKQPKNWIVVSEIPRNDRGKVEQQRIQWIVRQNLK